MALITSLSSCGQTYKIAKYLAGLFKPMVGKRETHVYFVTFAEFIAILHVAPSEPLVSLYIASLFTRVLLETTMEVLHLLFPPAIVELFQYLLKSIYLLYDWNRQGCNGVTLAPVIAKLKICSLPLLNPPVFKVHQ